MQSHVPALLAEVRRYRALCQRLLAASDGTESVYAVIDDVREALEKPSV